MHRLLLSAVLLVGCGPKTTDSADPSACPADGLAAGEVRVLASDFTVDGKTGTEGVSFSDDGRLFVGGIGVGDGGFVAEVFADGTWTHIASVPTSVGLAWADEHLLVSVTDTGDGTAGLMAVDVDTGDVDVFVTGMIGSNFPAVTPWGSVLVSSPGGTTVWEVADGLVSDWATEVPSPNGIGFSPDGATAYVANTYTNPSTVAAIPIQGQSAGPVGVLATLPDGSTQDGVAMDAEGHLYVVNNLPGTIARIAPDGSWEIVAEGVDFGASLAFGEGDWDPCSVIATSLFSADLFQVGVGHPGLPPHRSLNQ